MEALRKNNLIITYSNTQYSLQGPRSQSIFTYQVAGVALSLCLIFLGHLFHAEDIVRPVGISLLVAFLCDQIALQGAIFEELYKNLFPVYKQKVLKHEAGHFLVSYLLGCPVRGSCYVSSCISFLVFE